MSELLTKEIDIKDFSALHLLFGNLDENIKIIEKALYVKITSRNENLLIQGQERSIDRASEVIHFLMNAIKIGESIDAQKIHYAIHSFETGENSKLEDLKNAFVCMTIRGKAIRPKTIGQNQYIKAISTKDVVFGIGPAGTGKTYLAVSMAIRAFKNNEVNRIVITRPAIEAGESLGFLPGDLQMKVDPYLRPIFDAMYDILGPETYLSYKERGLIEIAPLAYMRGRTLDKAFIILDEAQNTTKEQMKMFLTRFGTGSKVVVNGDISQIDLPHGKRSGLINAIEVLKDINEIGFVYLSDKDVVRHELVKKIILSYDRHDQKNEVTYNEKKRQ